MYNSVNINSGSIDEIQGKIENKDQHNTRGKRKSYYESCKTWVEKQLDEKIEEGAPLPEKYKSRAPWFYKALTFMLATSVFIVILGYHHHYYYYYYYYHHYHYKVYFTYIGYVDDQNTKYISLDPTTYDQDNTSPYRSCYDVPNAITGTFTLDKNGYWNGMSAFLAGYGKYRFIFSEFEHDYTFYYNFMMGAKAAISNVGTAAKSLTSAQNLAYLMSWAYVYDDDEYSQKVTFTGDPVYVFNRYYKTASLGSEEFPCKAIPEIALNKATGFMEVQYDYGVPTDKSNSCRVAGSGYVSAATSCGEVGCCMAYDSNSPNPSDKSFSQSKCIIPPSDFGYKDAFDANHFALKYNIWSLMTSYAVNQNILSYDSLVEVEIGAINNKVDCFKLNSNCNPFAGYTTCSSSTYLLSYDESTSRCAITVTGNQYYMTARIDSRYPGMDPIICMIKDGDKNPAVCLLRMGNAFVYPYFNHMGTSNVDDFYNWKKGCFCKAPDVPSQYSSLYEYDAPDSNGNYLGGSSGYCNVFDLIHGFIIFKSNRYEDHLAYNILLAKKYTVSQIDTMSYYAGFYQIRSGGNAAQNPQNSSVSSKTSKDLTQKLMPAKPLDNSLTFCRNLDSTSECSIFAMNTYDEYDSRINAEGAIAPATSCKDSYTIYDSAWNSGTNDDDDNVGPKAGDGASRMPPSPLIQKYYQCYNTKYSSLLTAFGSASGSAGTIQPFVMWVFVFISIRMILRKKEKEEMIDKETDPRIEEIRMRSI